MTRTSSKNVVKAVIFVVMGVIAATVVVNTLRVPVSGPTTPYVISFADAEGVVGGNPVTIAGVRVGRVDSVRFAAQPGGSSLAEVRVEVQRNRTVPHRVHAAVRYGDMLGARYIELSDGGPGQPERRGNHIPVSATTPPINLTALMNGFEPLFSALEPRQVNELARGFVDTFEGRSGSIDLLLTQIATMGNNLSANSAIFARVVTNMNVLMTSVARRSPQLNELFTGLSRLTATIVGDNEEFGALLDSGDRAVASLARMMTSAQGQLGPTLSGIRDITGSWIPRTAQFTGFLDKLPTMAERINASGRYGGFMMLYLCNLTLKAFDVEANIFGPQHSPVCR